MWLAAACGSLQGAAMELGQRVSSHRGTFGAGGWLWYLAIILLLSGVVGLVKGGAAGDSDQMLTGVLALGASAVTAIVPLLRWRQTVDVFERGFVWKRLYGERQVARAEIRNATMITHHSRQGTRVEVKVELANGKSCSIVGVEQPEQLTNLLRAAPPSGYQPAANVGAVAAAPVNPQSGWAPGGWKPPGS
jgi:hypothetical protein